MTNINSIYGRELIYVKNDTDNFCIKCIYVIALKPSLSYGAKLDIFINSDDSYIFLRNG